MYWSVGLLQLLVLLCGSAPEASTISAYDNVSVLIRMAAPPY